MTSTLPVSIRGIQELYASSHDPVGIDAVLPPDLGLWPVSRPMARWLARLIVGLGRRSVLEVGAGWSAVVLAHALAANGGGRLTSVEHKPQYMGNTWETVQKSPGVDSALVVTGL